MATQKRQCDTFKLVLNVLNSKTSVATLPETLEIEILNVCISGQTSEAHEKKSIVSTNVSGQEGVLLGVKRRNSGCPRSTTSSTGL